LISPMSTASTGSGGRTGALEGLKVLELSEFISGPYCGKLMADLGAEVIKAEKPGAGDRARGWGPFPGDVPHPEKSGLFLFLNTNKSGITLNVESGPGQEIFWRLASWADVLIESQPRRQMARYGLGYRSLKKVNPSLVMTSISPFGRTGPFKDYKGSDLIASHTSSEAFGNPAEGVHDMERFGPLRGPMHAADFMTGLTAAVCTMSAVVTRRPGQPGVHIDVSAQEALASVVRQELAFCLCEGLCPTRQIGRKRRGGIIYPCKDGYVCIWIGPHWQKLVRMMGEPDWTRAEIFQNPTSRAEHMEDCNRLVELWTRERTTAEIDRLGIEYDVPLSPVRTVKELVADEQLAYRQFFTEVDHPAAGWLKYPGAPYKLSATPWEIRRPAPLLGEHNGEVYGHLLGYNRRELEKMRRAGII
jgi:crotonobetainyl-CoA:carnitine CoA-transferase CaiB-like acyl-CoA transferase